MKKTLLLSALIALATTGANATQAAPGACLSDQQLNAAILAAKNAQEFTANIEGMGFGVKQIMSSGNYHEQNWDRYKQAATQTPLTKTTGTADCYYRSAGNKEIIEVVVVKK
jgi:hypothetical protein